MGKHAQRVQARRARRDAKVDARRAERETRGGDGSVRGTVVALSAYLRPHVGTLVSGTLLVVLASAITLVQPVASKAVLDSLGTPKLHHWLVILIGLVVATAITQAIGGYLLLVTAEGVVKVGRIGLVRHMLSMSIDSMRRQNPGDLQARVTADTAMLRQVATQSLVQAVTGVVMLIGSVLLMAAIDRVLFGVVMGIVSLLAVVTGVVMPKIRTSALNSQRSVGAIGKELSRTLGAFTTVKASGAEAAELDNLEGAVTTAYKRGLTVARWNMIAGSAGGLIVHGAFLAVLAVGGARVASGAIPVSTLVAFMMFVMLLASPVVQLVNSATYFQAGRAALQRIGEVHDLPTEDYAVDERPPARADLANSLGVSLGKQRGHLAVVVNGDAEPGSSFAGVLGNPISVVFDDVSFTYPGRRQKALDHLSLELPSPGLAAFVGPSGAGKSTVLNLLPRFYEPDEGRIYLDGRDIREWDLRELRASIGYVEQEVAVLGGTLRDNLAYAAEEATDYELFTILRVTRLMELLQRLGGDLDAEIDHRGSSLSGGERQRIAIARALLRHPRLLILDEATSALDAVNEAALRDLIVEVADRITVICVAHRLSTVVSADQIVVMRAGRQHAVGRHEELVRTDPVYHELASHQLLGAAASS